MAALSSFSISTPFLFSLKPDEYGRDSVSLEVQVPSPLSTHVKDIVSVEDIIGCAPVPYAPYIIFAVASPLVMVS